ncbi:MAG: DUF4249 domain-containing protein [Bacteroidales bacterium]|nr:DUF4249 domain-containing protein [Bacteroidales bacterium]MDT8373467.1 DUF4249 domain-containing protein [Bacteroidales bacterium]
MRLTNCLIILSLLALSTGCITQFIPDTDETEELLVVEGVITDEPGVNNTVRLSKSQPLGSFNAYVPVPDCQVRIEDDLGNIYTMHETLPGTYSTWPWEFQGEIGRTYTLLIDAGNAFDTRYTYMSLPMEMKPVPPIDTIYFEKQVMPGSEGSSHLEEGCQVYLNTLDPEGSCKYYRWDFTETWEILLPYDVTNNRCWITEKSKSINIKSTSALTQDRIEQYPINFVTNETDRLNIKYSMEVNQYSVSEDEFGYWKRLQNISEDVGGLYDLIPSSITGNVFCVEDPAQQVLGYFSVSAKSSKRVFISENFAGMPDLYAKCAADTVAFDATIDGLDEYVWIIIVRGFPSPPPYYKVLTRNKRCADCTVRGTNIRPTFWDDDQN